MFTYAAIFSYCLTTNTSFIFRSSTSRGRYIRGITDTYFSFWLRSLGSATVHRQLPSHLLPLHQTPPCPPSPGPWTLTSSSTASSSQLMFKQSPPRLINFPLQLPVFDTVTSETSPTEPPLFFVTHHCWHLSLPSSLHPACSLLGSTKLHYCHLLVKHV